MILWKDIKAVLGKDRFKPLGVLWQLNSRVLGLYAILGSFSPVVKVSGSGSEIGGCGFWKYLHYKQVVSGFLVSTIGTGGEEGTCLYYLPGVKERSVSVQIEDTELCFLLPCLLLA